jgi:diguanylate cyclase (GGDEF)-like protein
VTNALKQVERHPRKEQQLLLADLDEFRAVNSCCGHAGGDQVLRSFGELLRDALEPGEVVGRFGGDAFMLLLRPGRNPSDAEGRASAILARLKDPFHCGGRPIQLRASIGIAAIRPGYVDADAVIADAELARETARAQGGQRAVRFQPQLRSASRGRIQLREELAESLRTQRFELHFQPVVSLDTGRPIGFEVLVRWRSLTRGLVPAAEFIGVAAEVGMVRLVGYRVLRLALEQLWRWQRGGVWYSGEYLSINLSAEQLGDGRLLEEINAGLHRHGIDPSALRFEIPEAALADETPEVRAWRERLLGQRVQVCLDGFGGERTPLSSLADMAFDCIKLDASLTAGVTHQGRAQNLIQTGIALGEQLGCLVIAKGIECREQRLALQRLGCLYGQGHELARPMSADDLAPWVTLWQAEHRAATHLDASPRTH